MKVCHAIRHVAFENLGAFAPILEEAGYKIITLDIGNADLASLPPDRPDLLIVLGGPIAADDERRYPFLAEERKLIEARLEQELPTLGICLGAQLIARAADAKVFACQHKEIGFAPIELTDAGLGSCLAPFREKPMTLHWHGDTFDLPKDATRLACSQQCENQAFSLGTNIIGFQFHPEADTRYFEHWLVGHAAELAGEGIDVPRLRSKARRLGAELEDKARQVLRSWLAGLGATR